MELKDDRMVSMIIVDYKTIVKTVKYIQSCYRHIRDWEKLHVIIVDNSDIPQKNMQVTEAAIHLKYEEIQIEGIANKIFQGRLDGHEILYVCAEKNLGYAGGNNLGSEISGKYYKDPYYLFSNNDMRMDSVFSLEQLMEPMKNKKDIAAVGPKILGLDGKHQSPWKRSTSGKDLFFTYFDFLLPKKMKITGKITNLDSCDVSKRCYWVTGSFLMVDAEKFNQAGKFDSHTFLYCEEMILAERLARYGYGMYFENGVTLIHEHGQTVKNTMSVLKGIQYSFESSLYYYEKYRKEKKIILVLAKLHFMVFKGLFWVKKRVKK